MEANRQPFECNASCRECKPPPCAVTCQQISLECCASCRCEDFEQHSYTGVNEQESYYYDCTSCRGEDPEQHQCTCTEVNEQESLDCCDYCTGPDPELRPRTGPNEKESVDCSCMGGDSRQLPYTGINEQESVDCCDSCMGGDPQQRPYTGVNEQESFDCCASCRGEDPQRPYTGINEQLPEGLIIGIGNPLLDISAHVGEDLLEKYNLKGNDAIMAEEKHMPLYKELMDNYNTEFIAGGSAQNSMRIAQWILKKPNICTYFGCIGDDNYGKILTESALASGVNIRYQITKEAPTGTCAVLITSMRRSLVANLAAAQKFTVDHLATEDSQRWIKAAKYIYATGFFVAVSVDSIMLLANQALQSGHKFMLNLSAPFVMQFFKEPLERIVEYTDIIMGNDEEAQTFAQAFNLAGGTIPEIALQMAALPQKPGKQPRTIIITQGADDVVLVENGKCSIIPIESLPADAIVDTNGAGDAFVGGFISQLVQNKPYKTCIECGIYAARYILQRSGCTLDGESNFVPSS